MNYPGNIKKSYKKEIDYKNRGMDLEAIITEACNYYIDNDVAIIYKKPTPIGVVDVDYSHGAIIKKAYFKEPSTLDYNGIYHGKYIEFDAKECHGKSSFPISNIHKHQITHIDRVLRHGGIAFLIINMNNLFFILKGEDLLSFLKNESRKSIPFDYLLKKGIPLDYRYHIGLDYIKGIDTILKESDICENTQS